MGSTRTRLVLAMAMALAVVVSPAASADPKRVAPAPTRLAAGLEGASGSTVGPDGALYVAQGTVGTISRVDRRTGAVTTYASGLPRSIVGLGGATDVAFVGRTAYVLVTLVGADVGGSDTVGIYRVDGPASFTVVADIGAYTTSNPPDTEFEVPSGLQFAMEPFRRGFLVTDGHHNRLLYASLDGRVSELRAFDNIVPTGLDVLGNRVYMAQAGPIPYRPEDGKVLAFRARRGAVTEVASGVPFLVDVEFGRGGALFALSQGEGGGEPAGAPATPDTGSLVRATCRGGLKVIADGLNRPTSLEIVRDTAYVVTLAGEVWRFAGISGRRHGSCGRAHR